MATISTRGFAVLVLAGALQASPVCAQVATPAMAGRSAWTPYAGMASPGQVRELQSVLAQPGGAAVLVNEPALKAFRTLDPAREQDRVIAGALLANFAYYEYPRLTAGAVAQAYRQSAAGYQRDFEEHALGLMREFERSGDSTEFIRGVDELRSTRRDFAIFGKMDGPVGEAAHYKANWQRDAALMRTAIGIRQALGEVKRTAGSDPYALVLPHEKLEAAPGGTLQPADPAGRAERPAPSVERLGPAGVPAIENGIEMEMRDILGKDEGDAEGQGWEMMARTAVWRGLKLIEMKELPPSMWNGSVVTSDGILVTNSIRASMLRKAILSSAEESNADVREEALKQIRFIHLHGMQAWLAQSPRRAVRAIDLKGPYSARGAQPWSARPPLAIHYLTELAAELSFIGVGGPLAAAFTWLNPVPMAAGLVLPMFALVWLIEEGLYEQTAKARFFAFASIVAMFASILVLF